MLPNLRPIATIWKPTPQQPEKNVKREELSQRHAARQTLCPPNSMNERATNPISPHRKDSSATSRECLKTLSEQPLDASAKNFFSRSSAYTLTRARRPATPSAGSYLSINFWAGPEIGESFESLVNKSPTQQNANAQRRHHHAGMDK